MAARRRNSNLMSRRQLELRFGPKVAKRVRANMRRKAKRRGRT